MSTKVKLQPYIGIAKQRIDVVLERGVILEIRRNMARESSKNYKVAVHWWMKAAYIRNLNLQ